MPMSLQRRVEVYQRGLEVPEGQYRLTPAQARRLRKRVNRTQGELARRAAAQQ